MCLTSKRKEPHVLKRDMQCWKVVYKSTTENGILKPVYYGPKIKYRLNVTHVERCAPDVEENWVTSMYEVGAGFVHALRNLKNAMRMRQQIALNNTKCGSVPVVCKCVIPAGTEVYSDRERGEVCARKMKFVKILES